MHTPDAVVILAMLIGAALVTLLARLDSETPPLDTKHHLHDLPEWYSFSREHSGGPAREKKPGA